MQRIKQVIDEVKELKQDPTHRSALRIFSLIDNNRKLFSGLMDVQDLNYFLTGFERIADENPARFGAAVNLEEYNKLCENFLFHCNRIV